MDLASPSDSAAADGSSASASETAAKQGKPVPDEEPPESVVVEILERQYAKINQAGGAPVTATASGKSMVLKPRIWEAHMRECRPLAQQDPGNYECSLDLMVTMLEGDDEPGQHAERVHVSWDAAEGEWVDAADMRERRRKKKQ